MSRPRSTRREFLQGTAAVDALADLGRDSACSPELPAPRGDAYLVKVARRAMACQFEFLFNAGQYPLDTQTSLAALDLVDRLEDQLTVYRETSEISLLNRQAAHEAVVLEPGLFALLQKAQQLHAETAGAYDITAGPLSRVWGFMHRSGAIPTPEALAAALESVGSQWVQLDPAASTARFTKAGVEINLGSIGKGYALDRAADLLEAAGIHDFILHGGNSSVLARGAHSSSAGASGWRVGVRNPLRPDRRLGELLLRNRALATSGSGTQFFMHDGRRYGHILDPRTGWPAEGVLSTSVLAPSAAEADALSTAFYVMGPSAAQEYCQHREDVSAVMLCPGRRAGSIEKHLFGLAEHDWSELDDLSATE